MLSLSLAGLDAPVSFFIFYVLLTYAFTSFVFAPPDMGWCSFPFVVVRLVSIVTVPNSFGAVVFQDT